MPELSYLLSSNFFMFTCELYVRYDINVMSD